MTTRLPMPAGPRLLWEGQELRGSAITVVEFWEKGNYVLEVRFLCHSWVTERVAPIRIGDYVAYTRRGVPDQTLQVRSLQAVPYGLEITAQVEGGAE